MEPVNTETNKSGDATEMTTVSHPTSIPTAKLSKEQLDRMVEMYNSTYSYLGKENMWWKTPDQVRTGLLYYEHTIQLCLKAGSESAPNCCFLYNERPMANKISVVLHDGTKEGKKFMMKQLTELLISPGWMMEASDALSWCLRTKQRLIPITDLDLATKMLNLDGKTEKLVPNLKYDPTDKGSQMYTHHYLVDGFANPETLFGTPIFQSKV